MNETKELIGRIESIGDIRANMNGKGHNLFIRMVDLKKGIYFFADLDFLEKTKNKLKPNQMVKLTYVEDNKGNKGNVIEVLEEPKEQPAEVPQGQTTITDVKDPTVKVVYCIWSNKNEEISGERLEKYETNYIAYADQLYKKIGQLCNDQHICDLIFNHMCQPFQYYIEDDLRVKSVKGGK